MLFSTSSLVVALLLAISASARPYEKRWGGWGGGSWRGSRGDEERHSWQPSAASPYVDFFKRAGISAGNCDLQSAIPNMNLAAVSPALPTPNPDLSLFQVVVGRGTQNYTCDLANATAVPVPVGAVATLYDLSCAAVDAPELLHVTPKVALDLPVPSSDDARSPMNTMVSGHHYFLDDTTPFFNLDTSLHQYGMGALQKGNVSDAPEGSPAGPFGQGDGAVAWLTLDQVPSGENSWKQIYRLNTAGGNPPKTCTGSAASFEVDYAAEYWIFR
ncbi:hypothetical protein LTR37_006039 [Vermiconidia calcicola]|uniref:Uncharacterized protein n=1 Tax=Vermiconidia calcicola TaxID=1690605 RepID=A0ACC3NHP2_9PEZI|nr:hypothetical protein LTR37_006039 [Vermiconidia calcicola]